MTAVTVQICSKYNVTLKINLTSWYKHKCIKYCIRCLAFSISPLCCITNEIINLTYIIWKYKNSYLQIKMGAVTTLRIYEYSVILIHS